MARAGHKPTRLRGIKPPPIPHMRWPRGHVSGNELPDPASLGVGSKFEVQIYLILKKNAIPFEIQVNFDGGSDVAGGERANFVLPDRRTIIEALGPWHDLPGQMLRDDRKWDRRRQEGWTVATIKEGEPNLEEAVLSASGKRL